MAILTGIICALIFIGCTALGAIYSLQELGPLGILSVAGFLIADIVMVWAAYIDYKEDGTGLEWTSWAVKFFLSAVLLLTGGAIAYKLFYRAEVEAAANRRAESTAKVRNETKDRRLARQIHQDELKADRERLQQTGDGWLSWYINWPLFKYTPGIAGLIALLALTLVQKLSKTKVADVSDVKQAHQPERPRLSDGAQWDAGQNQPRLIGSSPVRRQPGFRPAIPATVQSKPEQAENQPPDDDPKL